MSGFEDKDVSPEEFLRHVRELGAQKDLEDKKRAEDLEKEIQKSREARRARRADHTRSLSSSPEKQSAAPVRESSPVPSPRASTPVEHLTTQNTSVNKINNIMASEAPASPSSPTSLSRSGTLSWQQRRSRPLSQVAVENSHSRTQSQSPTKQMFATVTNGTDGSRSPSRVSTLIEKDPVPVLNRGSGPVISESSAPSISAGTMSNRQSMATSITDSASRNSMRSSSNYDSMESPLAATPTLTPTSVTMGPPTEIPGNGLARMGSISGRASPTRGMGGFVQSAMMKRSDSVSKRWSQTGPTTPGLSRSGSVASNSGRGIMSTSGVDMNGGARYAGTAAISNGSASSLDPTSAISNSRPSSIHSIQTITQPELDSNQDRNGDFNIENLVKPSLHSRSRSVASLQGDSASGRASPVRLDVSSPPQSPSKRWSPTKSSWLESKIVKSEEKSKTETAMAPPPSQPAWMADLAAKKQQKAAEPATESPRNSAVDSTRPFTPQSERSFKRETASPIKDVVSSPASAPLRQSTSAPDSTPKPAALSSASSEPERALSLRKSPPPPSQSSKPSIPQHTPSSSSSGPVDFRANLRSRANTQSRTSPINSPPSTRNSGSNVVEQNAESTEPEFKKALGGLKRTKTENYKAPDVLKDNIMRGKAGLTITGGPAKRERVDELKESLVKQREAMKEKAKSEPSTGKEKEAESIPEALAARRMLGGKRSPATSPPPVTSAKPILVGGLKKVESAPTATSNKPIDLPIKTPAVLEKKISTTTSAPYVMKQGGPVSGGGIAGRLNPALASMIARGPSPMRAGPGSETQDSSDTRPQNNKMADDEPPKESAPLTHITKGRARGPKRRAPKGGAAATAVQDNSPKEKSPTLEPAFTIAGAAKEIPEEIKPVAKEEPAPSFSKKLESTLVMRPLPGMSPKPLPPKPAPEENIAKEDIVSAKTIVSQPISKQRPATPKKSPTILSKSPPQASKTSILTGGSADSVSREIDDMLDSLSSPTKIEHKPLADKEEKSRPKSRPTSFVKMSTPTSKPIEKVPSPTRSPERSSFISVKNAASIWGDVSSNDAPAPLGRPKSPIKLPTKKDEDKAMVNAGFAAPSSPPKSKKPIGAVGLGLASVASQAANQAREIPQKKYPLPSPTSAGVSSKVESKLSPEIPQKPKKISVQTQPAKSQTSRAPPSMSIKVPQPDSEAGRLFAEVFDQLPTSIPDFNIDVQRIIETDALASYEKVQTVRMQIQELTGDGKLVPLPSNREHILFEDSMYLCVHTFKSAKTGNKPSIEAFLWAGHGVSPAAVEDAQLFARKAAKDSGAGGKLTVLSQGKELPNFFQALGGIVITFRSSRSRSTKTGLPNKFVLCGRRHMGHISFDEVDFAAASLCSGFTYLISSPTAKRPYLWRGAGSPADELSAARLIAMDVLGSEAPNEIDDGSETDAFLETFPPKSSGKRATIPPSASHWRLKPSVGEKYRARMFRVQERQISTVKGIVAGVVGGGAALKVSNFLGKGLNWAAAGLRATSPGLLPSPFLPPTGTNRNNDDAESCSQSSAVPSPKSMIGLSTSTISSTSSPTRPLTPKSPAHGPSSPNMECVVEEVCPFAREDLLEGEGVCVLDAFFEMYIILTPNSHSQPNAFSTALLFAQDYGIQAATSEDRPFVPVATVIVDGAPRDMKAVFRRWAPTAEEKAAQEEAPKERVKGKSLKRGPSMRTVSLTNALAALGTG